MKQNISILFTFLCFACFNLFAQDCVDDDTAAAALAVMWNPSITGCEDAIPYLESAGYPCDTDLSVLGMSGTISDICECTCEEEETLCAEGYTLLTLNYNNADANSFTVLNSSGESMASYSGLTGSGTIEDCFLTSDQNDCFTIDIEGGVSLTWDLLADELVILSGDASDFQFGPDCDPECVDDDTAAVALAGMWNPSITGCEDAIPYLESAGYPCDTDLSVLGMSGTISDICECTCEEEETLCAEGYTLLTLNYNNADANSFTVLNSSGESMASYSGLTGSGTIEDCFLTSDQNDCFTIDIEGGVSLTWDLLADELVILSGDASDFQFGPDCDPECVDDDTAAVALAGMWNPSITGCEDAIPYLELAGYPCSTDLSVLGMSGTIGDICQCTCDENLSLIHI